MMVFVVALIGVACVAACGGGVSTDPLGARRSEGSGGSAGEPPDAERRTEIGTEPRDMVGSGGRESPAGGLATGTSGCTDGEECESGACNADVTGEARCCERACDRETGRVCSTNGVCVCSARYEDKAGLCLLENGQACRADDACASGHCADEVCCDASCDGLCERCNAGNTAGSCVLDADDDECEQSPGLSCTERGRCRLGLGFTCERPSDCESDLCELATSETICCDRSCGGLCQKCGSNGACDQSPPADGRCPLVTCDPPTPCRTFIPPAPQACADNGHCAECQEVRAPVGLPCGVGQQCNGVGDCAFTGLGMVAAGARHTCAIRDNGNVRCWGSNEAGQLGAAFDRFIVGDDETPASVADLEIRFDRGAVQVTAGNAHTCVLLDDGDVRCWGGVEGSLFREPIVGLYGTDEVSRNDLGFVDPRLTGSVRLAAPALQISAGTLSGHTCAVLVTGEVSCWGLNSEGQCGIGTSANSVGGTNGDLATVDLGGRRALEVRVSLNNSCARLEGGAVSCWGIGLGYGNSAPRLKPEGDVDIGAPALGLGMETGYACALLERGHVRCWGANGTGQLGYGHTVAIGDDETPEEAAVKPLTDASSRFLGGDAPVGAGVVQLVPVLDGAVCAVYEDGSVRCWGNNLDGQLGYGHNETLATRMTVIELESHSITPIGLPTMSAGGKVSFGSTILALADNGRCATARDASGGRGPLFCWGSNGHGQLGIPGLPNSRAKRPLDLGPVQWEPGEVSP